MSVNRFISIPIDAARCPLVARKETLERGSMSSNKSMHTDQSKLSRLLLLQEPRQFALAADLGR